MGVPGERPNTQPLATGHALVDEVMAVVDALMRISSRTEGEFGSPAAKFFENALVRYCLADNWGEILRPEPERVNGSGHFGKAPTNPLAINPYSAHDFTTGLPTDGLSATGGNPQTRFVRWSGRQRPFLYCVGLPETDDPLPKRPKTLLAMLQSLRLGGRQRGFDVACSIPVHQGIPN